MLVFLYRGMGVLSGSELSCCLWNSCRHTGAVLLLAGLLWAGRLLCEEWLRHPRRQVGVLGCLACGSVACGILCGILCGMLAGRLAAATLILLLRYASVYGWYASRVLRGTVGL